MAERGEGFKPQVYDGIASFPFGLEVEVDIFVPDSSRRDVLAKRGITDEQMNQGVVNVKKGDYKQGTFKHVVFDANEQLEVINVDRGFGISLIEPGLTREEIVAVEAVAEFIVGNSVENGTEARVVEAAEKFSKAIKATRSDN